MRQQSTYTRLNHARHCVISARRAYIEALAHYNALRDMARAIRANLSDGRTARSLEHVAYIRRVIAEGPTGREVALHGAPPTLRRHPRFLNFVADIGCQADPPLPNDDFGRALDAFDELPDSPESLDEEPS